MDIKEELKFITERLNIERTLQARLLKAQTVLHDKQLQNDTQIRRLERLQRILLKKTF